MFPKYPCMVYIYRYLHMFTNICLKNHPNKMYYTYIYGSAFPRKGGSGTCNVAPIYTSYMDPMGLVLQGPACLLTQKKLENPLLGGSW